MKSLFKLVFILAVILTAIVPRVKSEAGTDTPKKELKNKVSVYYWEKQTAACISEQLLDNMLSAIMNGDSKSIDSYLKKGFCAANKKTVKVTMLDQGFNQAKFLYSGITFYAKNSAIITKQVEI